MSVALAASCACAARAQRLIPAGPGPARVLDVVDFQAADDDTKLAATTLQGIVNRGEVASVFLLLFARPGQQLPFWLEQLRHKGYIEGIRRLGEAAFFDEYLGRARGLVVYDPELPATINVATMIAGVESRVVVGPSDLVRFADRLPDVTDLRGRWQTNAAAYGWAFEELWPKLRHDVLATYHPTHNKHHLRDYLVSQRVFTFWVTGSGHDSEPWADHAAEKAIAEKALAATPPNIPIIGWWGADPDPGLTEYAGVGWAGEYGKITLGNNWQTNLSLLSGVPVPMQAVTRRFREREISSREIKAEPGKTYISFVIMESGDSPTYWQHIQKHVWEDPKRGEIPIGWTITPALLEMLPSVAEWFLDNASPNDHFALALSGWGYCHPYRGLMSRTQDPEAAWSAYLESSSRGMRQLGLSDLGLYTDAWKPFRREEKDAITRRFVEGIPELRTLILGMGRDAEITETTPHYRLGTVLVSHVFTRWDAATIKRCEENNTWLVNEVRAHTPTARPAFMFVHPISWSYHPSDLAAVADKLGSDYLVVSPGELAQLITTAQDAP